MSNVLISNWFGAMVAFSSPFAAAAAADAAKGAFPSPVVVWLLPCLSWVVSAVTGGDRGDDGSGAWS